MKKYYIILFAVVFAAGFFLTLSHAQDKDIELLVKSAECLDGDKILIKYSVTNSRNFPRPNIVIGFKILEGEEVVACKRLTITVPKDADGSEIYETTIDRPCEENPFRLKANMFRNVKQYKIEEWFEECP